MKKLLSRSLTTLLLAGLAFSISACNRQPSIDDTAPTKTTTNNVANVNSLPPIKGPDTIYIVTDENQLIAAFKARIPQYLNFIRTSARIYPHDISIDNEQHLHITYNIANIGRKDIKALHFTSFVSLKFNNKDYRSAANLILAIPLKYDLSHELTSTVFEANSSIDIKVEYNLKDLFNHTDEARAIDQYGIDQLSFANELNLISSITFADGQTVNVLPRKLDVKTIASKHQTDSDTTAPSSSPNSTVPTGKPLPKTDKANLTDG